MKQYTLDTGNRLRINGYYYMQLSLPFKYKIVPILIYILINKIIGIFDQVLYVSLYRARKTEAI